jgi:uncharacterized OsmC-like protein
MDTEKLHEAIAAVSADSSKAKTHWQVATYWKGGTRSDTKVSTASVGGERLTRDFTIKVDEPQELLGTNQFANPQEHLLAALNACMMVGYTFACAHAGIELQELRIETEGEIDLRGFMGLDATVKPGYDQLRYTVYIKGNGSPEQFENIHRTVMKQSPNYFNLSQPVPLRSRLVLNER